jgi:flavorubredoxin
MFVVLPVLKPVWDLLPSLALVNLEGKIGAAFGSYGWRGEAVRMIVDDLPSERRLACQMIVRDEDLLVEL